MLELVNKPVPDDWNSATVSPAAVKTTASSNCEGAKERDATIVTGDAACLATSSASTVTDTVSDAEQRAVGSSSK